MVNATDRGNDTMTLNHADPNLVCKPGAIQTALKFFLAIYVANCFTIRTQPGESPGSYLQTALILTTILRGSLAGLSRVLSIHSLFLAISALFMVLTTCPLVTVLIKLPTELK